MPGLVMATALEERIAEAVQAELHRYQYRDSPADRSIALHESAHCAASFISSSGPLHEVLIRDDLSGEMNNKPPTRPDGMCPDESRDAVLARLRKDHPDELRAALGKRILVQLSGYAADIFGESGFGRSASRYDEDEAATLAESAAGREGRDELLDDCRATADRLVRDAWVDIQGLSEILVDQRRLPGNFVETWLAARPRAAKLRDEYGARYAIRPSASATYAPPPPDDTEDDWWS